MAKKQCNNSANVTEKVNQTDIDVAWVRCAIPRQWHQTIKDAARELGLPVQYFYPCLIGLLAHERTGHELAALYQLLALQSKTETDERDVNESDQKRNNQESEV